MGRCRCAGRMRASHAAMLGSIALFAGLAGCIQGAFFPAEIAAPDLLAGWVKDDSNSQGGEEGVEPLVKARWQANAYSHAVHPIGAVLVISVSDVPLFDEQAEIKKQLDPRVAEFGVTLTERSRGSGTIGPDAVSYVVHDATKSEQGGTLKGLAIDVPYTCGANKMSVRVFGFAVTEARHPVLGTTQPNPSTWQELAGAAEQGSLGGMVTRVRCS